MLKNTRITVRLNEEHIKMIDFIKIRLDQEREYKIFEEMSDSEILRYAVVKLSRELGWE